MWVSWFKNKSFWQRFTCIEEDDTNDLDEEEIIEDTIETVDVAEALETETPIEEEKEVPADEIKPVFTIAEWNKNCMYNCSLCYVITLAK